MNMKKHKKICSIERDKIAYWYAIGTSIREMARRLNRSPSSICSEIKRNSTDGMYHSLQAEKFSRTRKKNCHKKYLLHKQTNLLSHVLDKLASGWSLQQISGRLRKEICEGIRPKTEYINHESIYQHIYDLEQKEQELWLYLPRTHKK
jgi:IS30 family transposase